MIDGKQMLKLIVSILLVGIFCQGASALDSDSEQPATLEADDFEMDFNTGVRIYRGNVVFRQGTIKLTCDELTTYLNENDELDKGICIGSPGRFKQRPEGQNEDIVGTALEITMDEIRQLVTLKSQAKVIQGGSTISGRIITYNKVTERAKVKGGGSQGTKSTTEKATTETSEEITEDGVTGEITDEASAVEDTGRPSIVIQPRKKKKTEESEESEE